MARSGFRMLSLLTLMLVFPVLLILSLAVAVTGCAQSASPPAPAQVLAQLDGGFAYGIAVDDTNVYVTSPRGPVLAIPVGGGAATSMGVEAPGVALAVDERRLYWWDGSSILACDKSTCANTVVVLAPSQSGVGDLTIDDTNVYWTNMNVMAPPGYSMKVNKNGGTPVDGGATPDGSAPADGGAALTGDAPVELALANFPSEVAVDATYVYWIEQIGSSAPSQPPPGPWRVPIAGGPAVQIAVSDSPEPTGLALDHDNVYFMDDQGALFTVPKSGGTPHPMLSNLGQVPTGLATDGTNLYIGAVSTLLELPLAGGFPIVLANDLRSPHFLAIDATSVYVADGDSVLKVAK